MTYNYFEEMKDDILNYINENFDDSDFVEMVDDAAGAIEEATESLIEKLNDDLWIEDSVTGNGSGSYFFNSYRAESAIAHNWDLIADMIEEFQCPDVLRKGPEAIDVSIRCYILSSVLWDMREDIQAHIEEALEINSYNE